MKRATVCIIGAGIAGLTTGLEVRGNCDVEVKILADKLPHETTSAAAGAIWLPYHAGDDVKQKPTVDRWAMKTLSYLRLLEENPASGVSGIDFVRLSQKEPIEPDELEKQVGCYPVTDTDVPKGYKYGLGMRVSMIDVPIYLDFLVQQFIARGGTIERTKPLQNFGEVPNDCDIIINCTGLGALNLCEGEKDLFKTERGQTAMVINPGISRALACTDPLMYILPRPQSGRCILGGTNSSSEDLSVDIAARENILAACIAAEPRLAGVTVEKDITGIRPVRKSVRLEMERLLGGRCVIHNYGHGGSGFTLSWGCAKDVRNLLEIEMTRRSAY